MRWILKNFICKFACTLLHLQLSCPVCCFCCLIKAKHRTEKDTKIYLLLHASGYIEYMKYVMLLQVALTWMAFENLEVNILYIFYLLHLIKHWEDAALSCHIKTMNIRLCLESWMKYGRVRQLKELYYFKYSF